ncbi:hypothetical protein PIB30_081931 [Stylosanthes scabra]|uniref:Uncharacterized protein n=1 Tax=Stylosanthes scabra TaxID=79078 RepID=A0ABU6XRD1_9FABA|nr:hypothetical protein [Stylosanthes scabra]
MLIRIGPGVVVFVGRSATLDAHVPSGLCVAPGPAPRGLLQPECHDLPADAHPRMLKEESPRGKMRSRLGNQMQAHLGPLGGVHELDPSQVKKWLAETPVGTSPNQHSRCPLGRTVAPSRQG